MKRSVHFLVSSAAIFSLGAAAYAWAWIPAQNALEDGRPDIRALEARLAKAEARLLAVTSDQVDVSLPEGVVWHATAKSEGELALQRHVMELASSFDFSPNSFGASGAGDGMLGFDLEGTAELAKLHEFLAALQASRPAIAIRSLSIRPAATNDPGLTDVLVSVRLSLWTYWEPGS